MFHRGVPPGGDDTLAEKQKSGKGNRKAGRKRKKPSQKQYTFERRWERNKERKAQKRANKFGKSVRIKIRGDWVTLKPKKR